MNAKDVVASGSKTKLEEFTGKKMGLDLFLPLFPTSCEPFLEMGKAVYL